MSKDAKKRGRRVRRILALVAVLVVVFYGLTVGLGEIIKHSAQTAAPMVAGVDVQIGRVLVNPFTGELRLRDVRVGPPKDFHADMFTLGRLDFSISIASLLFPSRPIRIREITVVDPVVTYEIKGLTLNDNLHDLLENLEPEDDEEEAEEEEEEEEGEGRKVVIDHFLFQGGRVKLAVWNGNGVPLPLPKIELRDIGAKSAGITGAEALAEVVSSIVTGTVSVVGDSALDLGGGVESDVKAAEKKIRNAGRMFKSLR